MNQFFVVSVYEDKMNFFQEDVEEIIVDNVVVKGKKELSALLRWIERKELNILHIQTINNTTS